MIVFCARFTLVAAILVFPLAFIAHAQFQFSAPLPLNTDAASDSGTDILPILVGDGAGTWVAAYSRGAFETFVTRSTTNGAT